MQVAGAASRDPFSPSTIGRKPSLFAANAPTSASMYGTPPSQATAVDKIRSPPVSLTFGGLRPRSSAFRSTATAPQELGLAWQQARNSAVKLLSQAASQATTPSRGSSKGSTPDMIRTADQLLYARRPHSFTKKPPPRRSNRTPICRFSHMSNRSRIPQQSKTEPRYHVQPGSQLQQAFADAPNSARKTPAGKTPKTTRGTVAGKALNGSSTHQDIVGDSKSGKTPRAMPQQNESGEGAGPKRSLAARKKLGIASRTEMIMAQAEDELARKLADEDDLDAAVQAQVGIVEDDDIGLDIDEALDRLLHATSRLELEERRTPSPPVAPAKPIDFILPVASDEWNKIVEKIDASDNDVVISSIGRFPLRKPDYLRLVQPTKWLNDEVINAYLSATVTAAKAKRGLGPKPQVGTTPPFHAFNSTWLQTIQNKGAEAVSRWASRVRLSGKNLLEAEVILIPINNSWHWTLLVIRPNQRQVEYLDSLEGSAKPFFAAATQWISHELGDEFDESEWSFVEGRSVHQANGYDCGAFVCLNAEATARELATDKIVEKGTNLVAGRRYLTLVLLAGGFVDNLAW